MSEIPHTIGGLCQMLVDKGECQEAQITYYKKEKLFTCIRQCKKLDGFIHKYWEMENEDDSN